MSRTLEIPEDERENVIVDDLGRTYFEHKGVQYIEVEGVIYPYGLEPDPNMTPEEMRKARKKEDFYIFAMRLGGIALVIMIALLVGMIVTR